MAEHSGRGVCWEKAICATPCLCMCCIVIVNVALFWRFCSLELYDFFTQHAISAGWTHRHHFLFVCDFYFHIQFIWDSQIKHKITEDSNTEPILLDSFGTNRRREIVLERAKEKRQDNAKFSLCLSVCATDSVYKKILLLLLSSSLLLLLFNLSFLVFAV